jgi:ATP-dependent DNA helicase RecG
MHHGMTLADHSFQRVELHEYPLAVIRELGVNMLAHRDYTLAGSAARVQLFSNRIEWISPGGLPPGITVDNLLELQSARNGVILSILYEAGYVEAFGQGLDTVVAVLKQERMSPPVFRDLGAAFIVTVFGRVMPQETGILAELTPNQQRIVMFLRSKGEAYTREIRDQMPDRPSRSLQRDIKLLIDAGVIETIGESVATQYRLRPGALNDSNEAS